MKDIKAILLMTVLMLVILSPFLYKLHEDSVKRDNGYFIHSSSLNGKNAVVVEKNMTSSGAGYFLTMKVRINDSIKYVEHVTPEIYNNYEVGDTIKRIETVYE